MGFLRTLFLGGASTPKVYSKKTGKYTLKDFDDTFIILKNILLLSGIRLWRYKDSRTKRFWWHFYYWFSFMNISVSMVLEFASMVKSAMEGSLLAIYLMMPCVGYLILANAKTYKLILNQQIYENIEQELRDMWPQEEIAEEENTIISKSMKLLNRLVKVYTYSNLALFIVFTIPPYVTVVKRLMGQDVPLVLSFLFLLPFDQFQRGVFEFMMVLQTWQCFIAIFGMISGDLVFCVLLSHITTQFDLLSVRIRKLFYVPLDQQLLECYPLGETNKEYEDTEITMLKTYNSSQWYERHQKTMTEIILRHRTLIRLSKDMEQQFSFAMLLNFMNGSIIICFCGFCCVFVEKWNVFIYKSFLFTAAMEIWLLCWFGQKLLDSSVGVADALYNSGWYNSSKKIRSLVLIMMHRGQKDVHITTYGFSVISLSSFSSIMKTSWSYFTLLINVVK